LASTRPGYRAHLQPEQTIARCSSSCQRCSTVAIKSWRTIWSGAAGLMYLKQLYVENNGPLAQVQLELPFTADGMPKPMVLVGGNGSGKTNLLSIIADALITAAARHYANVLPGMTATHKPWFRIVGGRTIRTGAPGSFTVIRFEHEGTTYFFYEKGGRVPAAEARARLPESLQSAANWGDNDVKKFAIANEQAGKIFQQGVYVYLPSSRAEAPHWLNTETVASAEFELQPRFTGRLPQPIYVEKALELFQQWILSVMLEARSDFSVEEEDGKLVNAKLVGDIRFNMRSRDV
jgi:hypothetical protein